MEWLNEGQIGRRRVTTLLTEKITLRVKDRGPALFFELTCRTVSWLRPLRREAVFLTRMAFGSNSHSSGNTPSKALL